MTACICRTHWVKAQLSACWCHRCLTLATPSPPPPWKKKKGGWGLGCLLLCCFCCVVGVDLVILYLPKEACHGGDASDDSWLKWQALLTVLRHSRILAYAIELDRQYPHPAPAHWLSRERFMSKAWFGCPRLHCMMEDM